MRELSKFWIAGDNGVGAVLVWALAGSWAR